MIVLPPIAFVITRRICLGLQRRDRDNSCTAAAGIVVREQTGRCSRSTSRSVGRNVTSCSLARTSTLSSSAWSTRTASPDPVGSRPRRAKVSNFYYGSHVDKPTPEEIEAAHHHDAELESATAEESVEHADRRELTGSAD